MKKQNEEIEEETDDDFEEDEETEDEEETEEEVEEPIKEKETKIGNVGFEYNLSDIVKSVRHLDTINIKATDDGLEFWGFNESKTMMTSAVIGKEHLKNFSLNGELEISTDNDYLKILKRLCLMTAYINEKEMIFSSGDKAKVELPVFNQYQQKPEMDLKNLVSFEISLGNVREVIRDISAIGSESFELEFKDNLAVFTAKGKGILTRSLEPYKEGITKYEKMKNSAKVNLNLNLFRNSLNGINGYKMRITIGDNSPVVIEAVKEYSPLVIKVSHYLAPKVANSYY